VGGPSAPLCAQVHHLSAQHAVGLLGRAHVIPQYLRISASAPAGALCRPNLVASAFSFTAQARYIQPSCLVWTRRISPHTCQSSSCTLNIGVVFTAPPQARCPEQRGGRPRTPEWSGRARR